MLSSIELKFRGPPSLGEMPIALLRLLKAYDGPLVPDSSSVIAANSAGSMLYFLPVSLLRTAISLVEWLK